MRKFIYKSCFLTEIYESFRWIYAQTNKILGEKEICPVWYSFDETPENINTENLEINKEWYSIKRPLYIKEHIYYNLDNALAVNPKIKGFALVFSMGLKDYLYTIPLIEALAKKYPQLELWAYAADKLDSRISSLLKTNPNIKKVKTFKSFKNPIVWKNFDYSEVVQKAPEDFLVLPVYYEYKKISLHRTASLFDTFGIAFNERKNFPKPVFYFPEEIPAKVADNIKTIKKSAKGTKGIILLKLDDGVYIYPEIDELARRLIWDNYFVVSVTKCGVFDPHFKMLDIKKFGLNETCHLLNLLKKEMPLYVISYPSEFWAVTAGLNIENLGLAYCRDFKLHNLYYPNTLLLTEIKYSKIPSKKQIVACGTDFVRRDDIIDFKVESILKYLKNLI